MSLHPLAVAGIILLAIGAGLYLAIMVLAVLRVRRQYSRAMIGAGGLSRSAALAAAGKYWYLLAIPVLGILLLYLGR